MLFHLRKKRFHPNEFRRKLLEASFENFIRDDSNDRAFKILYAIGESGHLEGSRMILSGPKDVGKTHLIHALLGRLLEKIRS